MEGAISGQGRDAEIFGELTGSANISAVARHIDGTRLVLGWRVVRRRRGGRGRGVVCRRWLGLLLSRGRRLGRVGDLWGGGRRMRSAGVLRAGEAAFLAVQSPSDAVVTSGNGGCNDDIGNQGGEGEQSKELHAGWCGCCWAERVVRKRLCGRASGRLNGLGVGCGVSGVVGVVERKIKSSQLAEDP